MRAKWIALGLLLLAAPTSSAAVASRDSGVQLQSPSPRLHSTSTSNAALAKAPTDTFTIFGGPGTLEGKFNGVYGRVPDRQGWIGHDRTDDPPYWQISTFNAESLGNHGPGNHALWCGQEEQQQPGWFSAPGYGNSWREIALFETPALNDTTVAQTVNLDFVFHHETEPAYDYFMVDYERDGVWVNTLSLSASDMDINNQFPAPGLSYSTEATAAITYNGNDYAGPNRDRIRIRLHFASDGGFSNEDGLWPTQAGAVQVDDISVVWSEGSRFEDFEGGTSNQWVPQKKLFVGDFSKVLAKLEDIDPCRQNTTPVMTFIDDGTVVNQCATAASIPGGPLPPYCLPATASVSPTWTYGVPNGYVVNYSGGVSQGTDLLDNEVWSPEIDWDLPGAADDGPDVVGAKFRYTMWDHLPPLNGIVATWRVRSSADGVLWSAWRTDDDGFFVYVGDGTASWRNFEWDVTPYLVGNPLKVQVALGVRDISDHIYNANDDATPSPVYDNVAFMKYRVGGPEIRADFDHLAQDGFPNIGTLDVQNFVVRDDLDIAFDMVADVGQGPNAVPGDSIVVDVRAVLPGTTVTDIRMFWVIYKNPLFIDAIRSIPARSVDVNYVNTPTQSSGEVLASSSTNRWGNPIADRFFFDLPDVNLFYPGDVLYYYIQATDSDGRVTTLPDDISGFGGSGLYDPRFIVRGLPSVSSEQGTQPTKLFVIQSTSAEDVVALDLAMRYLSFSPGYDYDTYWSRASTAAASTGIGSAGGHGATVTQLAGYDTIVFTSEANSGVALGDGSFMNFNGRADDLGLLTAWHALPGIRNAAHFGDSFASGIATAGVNGMTYLQNVLGVSVFDGDVRDEIDLQTTPEIRSLDANFTTSPVAYGGCPTFRAFDSLRPLAGSFRAHGFVDLSGGVYPDLAASVIHDRIEGGDRKVDATLPFGLLALRTPLQKAGGTTFARTELLRELLAYFGVSSGGAVFVGNPAVTTVSMQISPNPFNPRTVIRFAGLPEKATGSVRVYSLRGELVATLHNGAEMPTSLTWSGQDGRGRTVSSGVYLVEARVGDWSQRQKIALLK